MEEIKNWAFSICAAAIFGTIINLLVPEKSAQKTFTAVICVFFLCVTVSPLKNIKKLDNFVFSDIFIHEPNGITAENDFDDFSLNYIENEIKESVSKILIGEGITAKDILIKINISENGSININKFVITLDRNENIAEIKEKISKETGVKPEIIISEETKDGNN